MRKIYNNWLFVLLTIFFTSQSCVHDISEYNPSIENEGETEIVFTVRTPSGTIQTKALSEVNEDAINILQVMVFTPSGEYQHTAYATKLQGSSGTEYSKYKVKLRTGTYDLMVLANSSEELSNFPGGFQKGISRDGIIENLQTELLDKWNTQSNQGNGYKHIPMWAVKKNVLVNKDTDLMNDNGFQLIRLLARINVKLGLSQEQADIFKLTSIRYHNRRTKGQLIPNQWANAGTAVTSPSLVDGNDGIEDPLIYGSEYIANRDSCLNEIYVLEAPMGDPDLHPAYPCLVVGGEYNGKEGFYRIDFAAQNGETVTYRPILRNHTYDITILSVGGEGFTDPDDAYKSLPVNIEASVVDWNEGMMGDMYFDGQNYLSVVKGTYDLSSKAYNTSTPDNTVYIKTDYKGGWQLGDIEYDDPVGNWLEFMGGNKGIQNENSQRWFKLSANESGEMRSATIPIIVGRIKGKIIVRQHIKQDMELIILDSEENPVDDNQIISLSSTIWDSHTCNYTLKCYPADAEIKVSLVNAVSGHDKMDFINEDEMLSQGILTGKDTYPFGFQIKEFDMSEVKSKGEFLFPKQGIEYQFTMTYEGETLEKKFRVINELKDVQVTKLGGCMQGRFYEVEIRYNTGFKLEYGTDAATIMDTEVFNASNIPVSRENPNGIQAETFKVKLKIDSDLDGNTGSLKFALPGSPEKIFDQVDVTSYYNHPNSFIVTPSGSKEFSIVKAYRMWESEHIKRPLGNSTNLTTEVIWKESGMGVSAELNTNNNIRESMIRVNGGGKAGNAVVGLFLDGEVIWSWHIWVTDLDLNNGGSVSYSNGEGMEFTLMRRNLGANSTELGDEYEPLGLYYQWGRKDPFPTCANNSSIPSNSRLGSGGNKAIEHFPGYYVEPSFPPTAGNSLKESIRRPDRFFRGMADPYDWYSHNGSRYDNTLWRPDDMLKSEFDPCPDGWRVPNYFVDKESGKYHYTLDFMVSSYSPSYGWTVEKNGENIFLPSSGYIDKDGYYKNVGSECWIWYGVYANETRNGQTIDERRGLGDRTYINNGSARIRTPMDKATAMPVRCEKDRSRYWPAW